MIIAPHEIKEQSIQTIISRIRRKAVRYSQLKDGNEEPAEVLIIDNIGMLSSLYRYGKVAYIGGGFGKGIHNILEAATFGLPVLFGPNYGKFQEAVNLIKAGGAFPVADYSALKAILDSLITDTDKNTSSSRIARQFVKENLGATNIILELLLK
jgi:3-deoxy-D-manno-octulosonic-acid transferase